MKQQKQTGGYLHRNFLVFCAGVLLLFLLVHLVFTFGENYPVRIFDEYYDQVMGKIPERASHIKIYNPAELVFDESYEKRKEYLGLKVTWYGDSLTNQYNYCRLVDRYFHFIGHNSGMNDTTIANINDSSMCVPVRMKYDVEDDIAQDSGIIFVMGGVNDWIHNIPLGDTKKAFEDTQMGILENKTFAGACNQMFYYLREGYPNARIIVLGTSFAYAGKYEIFENTDGVSNELGLSSVDYGKVLCETASLWGIENMNIGEVLAWNQDNIYQYCTDGIHFDIETGSVEAADAIIDFLMK